MEEERDDLRLHGFVPASTRRTPLRRLGLEHYAAEDPAGLPVELRTPAWQKLCEHLASYDQLPANARMRLLWLLHRIGFQAAILAYEKGDFSGGGDRPAMSTADEALLRYMRARAKVTRSHDGELVVDRAELESVVALAAVGSWAHMEATYLLAQVSIKAFDDVRTAARSLDEHARSIAAADVDEHDRNLLLCRYHRALAFVPQLAGDLEEMAREMDLAEAHCDRMLQDDDKRSAETEVLRYALMESRIKEKLVLGDLGDLGDLGAAERHARGMVAHAPADPRARLHLGQVLIERGDIEGAADAYRWGSLLGPHVEQEAEFMLGQCLEALGRQGEARASYLKSITADPPAISAAEKPADGGVAAHQQLRQWSRQHLGRLATTAEAASPEVRDYQKGSSAPESDVLVLEARGPRGACVSRGRRRSAAGPK